MNSGKNRDMERDVSKVATEIDMWRARVPGDFSPHPLPMVVVMRAPQAVFERANEDALDAEYRTWIWFHDRRGWQTAWRLARLIAGGRQINASLVAACGGKVICHVGEAHYAHPPKNFAPGSSYDFSTR